MKAWRSREWLWEGDSSFVSAEIHPDDCEDHKARWADCCFELFDGDKRAAFFVHCYSVKEAKQGIAMLRKIVQTLEVMIVRLENLLPEIEAEERAVKKAIKKEKKS